MDHLGIGPKACHLMIGLTLGCEEEHEEVVYVQPHERIPRREFKLGALDQIQPKMWMPNLYAFENAEGRMDFMHEGKLVWGLARALSRVPILAGDLAGDRVKAPGFGAWFSSQRVKADFQLVKAADFNYEVIDKAYLFRKATCRMLKSADGAPLLAAKATYFSCGSVLLMVNMSHVIADGSSMFEFMKLWAASTKGGDPCPLADARLTLKPSKSPPQSLTEAYSKPPRPLNPYERNVRLVKFSIAKETFSSAKNLINFSLGERWVSSNDLICAAIWRALTRARRLPKDTTTRLRQPINIRPLLKLPATAFANMTYSAATEPMAVNSLLTSKLKDISLHIRKTVAAVSPSRIQDHLAAILAGPSPSAIPDCNFHFGTDMHISDYSHFDPSLIDFHHSPSLINHVGFVSEGFLIIYPASHAKYCHLGVSQDYYHRILHDEELHEIGIIPSVATTSNTFRKD